MWNAFAKEARRERVANTANFMAESCRGAVRKKRGSRAYVYVNRKRIKEAGFFPLAAHGIDDAQGREIPLRLVWERGFTPIFTSSTKGLSR